MAIIITTFRFPRGIIISKRHQTLKNAGATEFKDN
jgi:hypothetical protein